MPRATPLPSVLAARETKVVRPRDAESIYSNPGSEFRRLADAGLLVRLAHGYYAIPPRESTADSRWRPSVEAAALGIGLADYGRDEVTLTGISAARVRGQMPRAVAAAVVSVPVRRPPVKTISGTVEFWHRDTAELDVQRVKTELAEGWVTTDPQTLLDLADRPALGRASPAAVSEVMWLLAQNVDWEHVHEISRSTHRRAAYTRAVWVCAGIMHSDAPPPRLGNHRVASKGLRSWSDADRRAFGIADD